MIDDLAKAIFERRYGSGAWAKTHELSKEDYRAYASVVIDRLLHPNEAMLDAARYWSILRSGQSIGDEAATYCLRAMLAAAKS